MKEKREIWVPMWQMFMMMAFAFVIGTATGWRLTEAYYRQQRRAAMEKQWEQTLKDLEALSGDQKQPRTIPAPQSPRPRY